MEGAVDDLIARSHRFGAHPTVTCDPRFLNPASMVGEITAATGVAIGTYRDLAEARRSSSGLPR